MMISTFLPPSTNGGGPRLPLDISRRPPSLPSPFVFSYRLGPQGVGHRQGAKPSKRSGNGDKGRRALVPSFPTFYLGEDDENI
jgi:hypothetical protein